jgi:hypothetical protein
MARFRRTLAASALVALSLATATASSSAKSVGATTGADEFSAAQSNDQQRRKVQRRQAPVQNPQPRVHRGFADPSFGPDGKPYPVPENLRNQCYIDEGYGRFSACSFRN